MVVWWYNYYSYTFCSQHIEGAVKFNVDAVADKSSDLPRALPPIEQFEDYIGKVMWATMRMPLIIKILNFHF